MTEVTSIEEAGRKLDEVYNFINYLDTSYENCQDKLDENIINLLAVERHLSINSIISPNEEFEEILPENLKYLMLPYLIADLYSRKQQDRLAFLNKTEYQYSEYIKLMSHYLIAPSHLVTIWRKIRDSTKYECTRDEKIQLHKELKSLEDLIKVEKEKYLAEGQMGDPREYMRLYLTSLVYKSIDQLKSIPMEKEMLEFRQKLQEDQEFKEQYERDCAKPIPKPQAWRIPAPGEQAQRIQTGDLQGAEMIDPNNINARMEKLDRVFQPCYAQPKMLMEDHGMLEERLMIEKQNRNKIYAEEQEAFQMTLTQDEKDDIET